MRRWGWAFGVYLGLMAIVLGLLLPLGAGVWFSLRAPSGEGSQWTWAAYARILSRPGLLHALRNSLIIASAVTALVVGAAGLAGYSLSRYRPAGMATVLGWVISLRMFPLLLALLPLFRLFVNTGLGNTLWGIVLAQGAFSLPFTLWLGVAYFRQIPSELYEAAAVEGASDWTILRRVALPLVKPGLGVIAFYAFALSWNDYVIVSVVAQSLRVTTLPFTLVGLANSVQGDPHLILALTSVLVVPPLVLYAIVQRQLRTEALSHLN